MDEYKNNDDINDKDYSYMYDSCDKAYENYCMDKYYKEKYCLNKSYMDKYDDSYNDSYNDSYTYSYSNYEELISLTKQEETKYTHKNIVFALIKLITIKKIKEVSFKFDFKLGPYESWINIAKYFNSNYVGKDYRILIDEDAIVCRLLNDDLIA
jgi:hypothetical protein